MPVIIDRAFGARGSVRTVLVLVLALLSSLTTAWTEQEHPLLICKREQFRELLLRSRLEPWKSMGQQAVQIAGDHFTMNPKGKVPGEQLQLYVGAVALAYIIDTANRPKHAQTVRTCIERDLKDMLFGKGPNGWEACVPPMCAAFLCIIALDIVYNDLKPDEIASCEAIIESQIKKIARNNPAWPWARLSTYGTWDIYKGVMTGPDDRYYNCLMNEFTEDGVPNQSPVYSVCRQVGGNDRLQKAAYMDVLEFTGIDRRYYKNEKLRAYFRWVFSVGYNPAGFLHLFGDVHPRPSPDILWVPDITLPWRIGLFDEVAAGYVARAVGDKKPPAHVLTYVLMSKPLPKPLFPKSELYMKGGAFLRERQDSKLALGGALLNLTSGAEFHTHNEVNAIALNAYGNNLLMNGGWLAPSTRPPNRNNTLDIDGKGHKKMLGAGLEEGLVGGDVEYACGLSGDALGDDSFSRSLLMVHPVDQCAGYFVVVDEVDADANEKVHSYLQSASESPIAETTATCEYRETINHHCAVKGVSMSIFFATEPLEVKLDEAPSSTAPGFGSHRRMTAIYGTDAAGDRRIVTVLFPHDGKHAKSEMKRVNGEGFTGAYIGQGKDVTDCAYESDGTTECTAGDVSFRAKVVFLRQAKNAIGCYFARKARNVAFKPKLKTVGFESDAEVSIYLKGAAGSITGPGANVTFHAPGIRSVLLNGEAAEIVKKDARSITAAIPAGRYTLELSQRAPVSAPKKPTPPAGGQKPDASSTKAEDLLKSARSAEGSRQLDDAKALYKKIVDEYPHTTAAKEAAERLEKLR